ncbi:MAG: protein jag [Microcystaceae cyanobacterium]
MMDKQIERGKEWLETLMELMGIKTTVSVEKDPMDDTNPSVWLVINEANLTPEQINRLIGSQGEGIDTLQYIANTLINMKVEYDDQRMFTIELAGYRLKRQTELKNWAQQVAGQVRQTGQEVEMKSLSSAERRQVHNFLKDETDLETESRGHEPDRRLVIRLRLR